MPVALRFGVPGLGSFFFEPGCLFFACHTRFEVIPYSLQLAAYSTSQTRAHTRRVLHICSAYFSTRFSTGWCLDSVLIQEFLKTPRGTRSYQGHLRKLVFYLVARWRCLAINSSALPTAASTLSALSTDAKSRPHSASAYRQLCRLPPTDHQSYIWLYVL